MHSFIKKRVNRDDEITAKISEIEYKYDIVIPKILKTLYYQIDDGYIRPCYFFVNGNEFDVHALIPILNYRMNFEYVVDNDRIDGFYPENFYPIAYDAGGALYYWEYDTGKVYFSSTPESICFISNSIEDFIDLLEYAAHI